MRDFPQQQLRRGSPHLPERLADRGQAGRGILRAGHVVKAQHRYIFRDAQPGAVWPFDSGSGAFIILNLAVGGDWPGSPDNTTPFPSQVLVDYVRLYTN